MNKISPPTNYLDNNAPLIEYSLEEGEGYFNFLGFWMGDTFPIREELYLRLNEFLDNKAKKITFNFQVINMPTADELYFFNFVKKAFSLVPKYDFEIKVNFYYHQDDLDMLELAEEWQDKKAFPINLIMI